MIYKVIFPVLALLLLLISYYFLRSATQLYQNGERVQAIVKDIDIEYEIDLINYYPIFQYEVNGSSYTYRYNLSSKKWKNKKGTYQTLVYNKTNPNQVKVVSFWGLLLPSVALSCGAVVLLIISGWYFWYIKVFE